MTQDIDNMQDFKNIMYIMELVKNAAKELPADPNEAELAAERLAQNLERQFGSPKVNEDINNSEYIPTPEVDDDNDYLRDIQDIIKNAYQMTSDPKIQSAINEVLESSEQTLKDTETQKHVEEFMQENNKILKGLGLPEFSSGSPSAQEQSSQEFENYYEYNLEESGKMQLELCQYLNTNPNCHCFIPEASDSLDEMNKIHDLIDNFNFAALPKNYSGKYFSKLDYSLLKARFQFKRFYTHYKGLIQTIDKWLLKNQYATNTKLLEALLGIIQDQFEIIHNQCLKKHPIETIQRQQALQRADQAKFQEALQVHNVNIPANQNVGASYYFFKGYCHFEEGKISDYIKDVQNLTQHIQCLPDNLLELSKPYINLNNVSENTMQLYIQSIEQFLNYLKQDSPVKETMEQAFEFILAETSTLEFKHPWKKALHYENLAQVFQKCSTNIPGINPADRSNSKYLQIDGKIFEHAEFAVINGINNELDDAMKLGGQLKEYTSGHRVHVLFNATQGKVPDILEWLMTYTGNILTPAVALAAQFIKDHFNKYPNKKLFFISHSCGGAILKAALKEISPEKRDLIVIRNMGGGAYIPLSLCKNAINFVSKNDAVSAASHLFGQMYANQSKEIFNINDYDFISLNPKPGSPMIDHTVQSPTYQDAIVDVITYFINEELGNEGHK